MPKLVVDYTRTEIQPSAAFPRRTSTVRPFVALNIFHDSNVVNVFALADSGADVCLFPTWVAASLGIDVSRGQSYTFTGAGGSGRAAFFHDMMIDIGGLTRYTAPIGFTSTIDRLGYGLLGQNGFFDRFDVTFRHRAAKLEISFDPTS